MGWGDDFLQGIQETAQKTVSGVTQSAGSWIESKVGSSLIKVGPKPAGNLSAEEIANGERGGQPGLNPSNVDPSLLARAGGAIGVPSNMMLPILIGGVVLVIFALRRR